MPGMDGIEAARRMEAMPLKVKPRRVIVTAYGREEVFHEAEGAGLDSVLVKPVSPSLLFDTAIRALAGDAPAMPEAAVVAAPEAAGDLGRLRGARVLLVEDNELNQQVAMELLGSADIEVDLASNGEEGVRRVQEKAYGLVLMDLQMPVMDGFEATRRIRALPGFERLPILAMTANAMAGDRERSLAAGMNDHVTKPIDPDALFDALLRWLPAAARGASRRRGRRRCAAAPAAAAPRGKGLAADDPLGAVPGLDAGDGLRRVLGKREAYVGLLRTFASGQAGAPEAIRAALAEGRRADAERAAHTLKGVAGSIGARAAAGRGGARSRRRCAGMPRRPRSWRCSRPPRRRSRRSSPRSPPWSRRRSRRAATGPVDPEALRAAVERIERLLEQDDIEAVAALDAAAPLLAAAFGERAAALRKLVKGYRFEEALAALREAARRGYPTGGRETIGGSPLSTPRPRRPPRPCRGAGGRARTK